MGSAQKVKQVDKACEFLRQLIDEVVANGGARLPPLRTLSRRAGIAAPTVYRAIQKLKLEGVIQTKPGSGFVVAPAVHASEPAERNVPPWKPEAVCARIERDILGGFYEPAGKLATIKEMMVRYGASYRTLKQALELLAAHGAIVPTRHAYRIIAPHPQTNPRKLVIFEREGYEAVSWWNNKPRIMNHVYTLDRECRTRRLVVERRVWRGSAFLAGHEPRFSERSLSDIVGFLIFTPASSPAFIRDLVRRLATFNRPTAILDEKYGAALLSSLLPPKADVHCFSMGLNENDGIAVGRYLLRLGHTRFGYLTSRRDRIPSVRLSGLRKAAALAGPHTSVREIRLEDDPGDTPADECLKAFEQGLAASQAPAGPLVPLLMQAIRQESNLLNELIREETIVQNMGPALEDALSEGVTAFVAFDDTLAALCLRHLRSTGVAVPGTVSVVGFDDSPVALANDLTSYSLNAETAIRMAVGHLLYRHLSRKKRRGVETLEGHISERGTSGPVGG